MAKIFAFPQSSGAAVQDGLEMFVDNGKLLEFAPSGDGREKLLSPPKDGRNTQNFDWTNQERADLYRAHALIQAARPGLECDQGVSDEGDPWFLIGDQHGDVLIHICRVDGMYILDSVTLPQVLTGKDFKSLLDGFLLIAKEEDQETAEPANVIRLTRGGALCLHPSMMIAALIWTVLLEIDGLALPISGSLADQNEDESSTQDINLASDLAITISLTDSQNTQDQESNGMLAAGWSGELSQIQRDEKAPHTSASSFSYALTTIAAAAGIYTGAHDLDALWGSAEDQESPSGIPEATEQKGDHSEAVALNPLADAFAILSHFADFDFFEGGAKNISDMLTASDASALDAIVTLPDSQPLEISSPLEIFTEVSTLIHRLAAETSLNHADAMHRAVEASGSDDVMTNVAAQADIEAQNSTEAKEDAQQLSLSGTTIQNISKTLTSADLDVTRYDASSLKEWVATADDKLLKTYDILERVPSADDTTQLNLGSPLDTTSSGQDAANGAPSYSQFTDDARDFIQNKLETSDMEILLFKNEILLFDKATVTGSTSSISWQLDDGNVISMIGFSAEFSELFVA